MEKLFISNQTEPNFIELFLANLKKANEVLISVSFIKHAGLIVIINPLLEALQKGTKVKIITSTYKNFTDVPVLERFILMMKDYPTFECKLEFHTYLERGFHTKGYVFLQNQTATSIIGSTNLTRSALYSNFEWNSFVEGHVKDDYHGSLLSEFYSIWNHLPLLTAEMVMKYDAEKQHAIESWDMDYELGRLKIEPNDMQKKALIELQRNRKDKALIVAAMGTGKTYLAAMDAKAYGAKKVLFVVHRENILDRAIEAFKNVFGDTIRITKYLGQTKDTQADFVFTTNQTINRHFTDFEPHYFDYIIVDEGHHAVANSYRSIMNYFRPGFLLGLTGTPERMDRKDVYALFDYVVPFEIRLREAIMSDLIVPFQYFGVRNENINYDEKYTNKQLSEFIKQFASEKNASFISREILKHPVNGKLKAIGFCSHIDHAKAMTLAMKKEGFECVTLIGEDSPVERERVFNRLSNDNDPLQIIFTVDILNEGIDIPSINLVLFLRPTDSVTIFIQQLGRGLRKHQQKKFLTVLDFIGNSYKRSIYIAKALGTLSNVPLFDNKKLIHLIKNDFSSIEIPNFKVVLDELSKEEILKYLENENENTRKQLIHDYNFFKKSLSNSIPKHVDFLDQDKSPDLIRFIRSRAIGRKLGNSYYAYLHSIGESAPLFNSEQIKLLNFLSNLLPLVRLEEFLIVRYLIDSPKTIEEIKGLILKSIEEPFLPFIQHSLNYIVGRLKPNKYKEKDAILGINSSNQLFIKADISNPDFKDHLLDLLTYGLTRFEKENGFKEEQFIKYKTYYNHQFLLALCADYLMNQKGTIVKDKKVYILANLKKEEATKEALKYNDLFIDPQTFMWESQNKNSMNSNPGKKLIHSEEAHLFVRAKASKNNLTLPLIYLGKGKLTNPKPHESKPTIFFTLKLNDPIPSEIYEELRSAHE
jgi:superfamily II DNA or RNA helicase